MKYDIELGDLSYNGKQLLIPSYWASSIAQFISGGKSMSKADSVDRTRLLEFLNEVADYEGSPDRGN